MQDYLVAIPGGSAKFKERLNTTTQDLMCGKVETGGSRRSLAMKWLTFLVYFPVAPLLFMAWIDDANLNHLVCGVSLIPALTVGTIHLKQPSWRARLLVLVAFLVAGALGSGILVFGWLAISLLFASAQGAQAKSVSSLMVAFTVLVELVVPILGALVGSRIAARKNHQT